MSTEGSDWFESPMYSRWSPILDGGRFQLPPVETRVAAPSDPAALIILLIETSKSTWSKINIFVLKASGKIRHQHQGLPTYSRVFI